MSKIIKYKVLSYYDTPIMALEPEVNRLLEEGWCLYGDIKVCTNGDVTRQTIYTQAMVKYDSQAPPSVPDEADPALKAINP